MEQQQPQALAELLHQPSSSLRPISDGELPELTQEEAEAAILRARKDKQAVINRENYWKQVKEEPQPILMTSEDLRIRVLHKFQLSEGKEFILDQDNSQIFNNLLKYFAGEEGPLDRARGILLCGNVGVGKTEMMRLFSANPLSSFGIISCRQVVDGFIRGTDDENKADHVQIYSRLRKASKPNLFNQDWVGTAFDDLGTEQIPAMHYGNAKNVMAEIILNRYDAKIPYQYTHITTNLPREAPHGEPSLLSCYGSRVLDRMNQMFNIVPFPQLSSRR